MPVSQTDPINTEQYADRRLRRLVGEARRNEATLRRFQTLELSLMSCSSIADLLRLLLHEARAPFAWDAVSLTLLDRDSKIAALLRHVDCSVDDFGGLLLANDPGSLRALCGTVYKSLLGPFEGRAHSELFSASRSRPASIGLVPLNRAGHLLGSYNLGSNDLNRFKAGAATDFLQHLGVVIALCLEMMIARENLKVLGLTDALTGVNNRRYFDQRIEEEASRALRNHSSLSCLMIDIDYFKQVNDEHGHPFGDSVLRSVAELIRAQLRQIDVIARFGGEEFAVVLGAAGVNKAVEVAERIRKVVSETPFESPSGKTADITLSIGIATLQAQAGSAADEYVTRLVKTADEALYQAKLGGRNQVRCA